jgi:potassium efflux system protein
MNGPLSSVSGYAMHHVSPVRTIAVALLVGGGVNGPSLVSKGGGTTFCLPLAVRPRLALLLLALLLSSGLFAADGNCQPMAGGRSFALVDTEWQRTLNAVEKYLENPQPAAEQRQRYDTLLSGIAQEAQAIQAEARGEIDAQNRLLEALGPVPAEGQPAEARDVARERKDILDAIGLYQARIAQAELAATRARALQEKMANVVRRRFVELLVERYPSPLAPGVAVQGATQLMAGGSQLARAPIEWYQSLPDTQRNLLRWLLPAALVPAVLVAWALRRLLLARYAARRRAASDTKPTLAEAGLRAVGLGAVPVAMLAISSLVLVAATDIESAGLARDVLLAFVLVLLFLVVVDSVCRALLATGDEGPSLTTLQPEAAARLRHRILFLAAIFAVGFGLRQAAATLSWSPEQQAMFGFLFCSIAAFAIVLAMHGAAWRTRAGVLGPAVLTDTLDDAAIASVESSAPEDDVRQQSRLRLGSLLRRGIAALAVAAPVAAALGYTRLGVTLVDNILLTGLVIVGFLLLRALAREVLGLLAMATANGRRAGLAATATRAVCVWLRALVGPALALLAVYLLAPYWGLPREDLERWSDSALSGFTIGGVRISLSDIAVAALVFTLALTAARTARRTLSERLLPQTRLDRSVQQSISTGAGYAGVVLAVILAVRVLGIDLSNVALVAGALSVGIGLGLQNIVNNFVSGLVLLIERPVKVGDWVGVGDKQGLVRRINVRSTELSTFERSTVILPNSQLLSSPVVNWTHRDKVGRIDIRVVVAFGADTEKVRATLLACAAAHPEILPRPEPFVLFLEFGDSALIFELRAFLRDVEKRARVGSDLRFSIEKAFRDAQIELPYAPGRTGKSLIQSPPIEKAPKVEIARGSGGGVR